MQLPCVQTASPPFYMCSPKTTSSRIVTTTSDEFWRLGEDSICHSNHQWNSGHLVHDADGTIYAFVVAGDGYLEGGYMITMAAGGSKKWISRTMAFLEQT